MQQNSNDKKPSLSWSAPVASTAKPATSTKMPAVLSTNGSPVGRYVGIFSAGLIVGILLSWAYTAAMSRSSSSVAATADDTMVATTNTGNSGATKSDSAAAGVTIGTDGAAYSNAALDVASTQKAGLSVSITKVTVTKPTWVVVYEGVGGKPANVLGAHLFFSTGAGTVTLLRSTTAGAEYFVGTSIDNGDRKYAKATDKASTLSDGSLEVTRFTAN